MIEDSINQLTAAVNQLTVAVNRLNELFDDKSALPKRTRAKPTSTESVESVDLGEPTCPEGEQIDMLNTPQPPEAQPSKAQPSKAQPSKAQPSKAQPSKAQQPTLADLRVLASKYMAINGHTATAALLAQHGGASLSEIPVTEYAALTAALTVTQDA